MENIFVNVDFPKRSLIKEIFSNYYEKPRVYFGNKSDNSKKKSISVYIPKYIFKKSAIRKYKEMIMNHYKPADNFVVCNIYEDNKYFDNITDNGKYVLDIYNDKYIIKEDTYNGI